MTRSTVYSPDLLLVFVIATAVAFLTGAYCSSKIPPYSRSAFPHWIDADRDCQDARAELLIDSSQTPVILRGDGCTVQAGQWYDPYTGEIHDHATWFDADHVVPLKDAWEKGAWTWNRERRRQFANDPLNVLLVSASENRRKGAKTPADYMPPNTAYHCPYLQRYLAVKRKYDLLLSVTEAVFVLERLKECDP